MIQIPFKTNVIPYEQLCNSFERYEVSRWAVDEIDEQTRREILQNGWGDQPPGWQESMRRRVAARSMVYPVEDPVALGSAQLAEHAICFMPTLQSESSHFRRVYMNSWGADDWQFFDRANIDAAIERGERGEQGEDGDDAGGYITLDDVMAAVGVSERMAARHAREDIGGLDSGRVAQAEF